MQKLILEIILFDIYSAFVKNENNNIITHNERAKFLNLVIIVFTPS